MRQKISHSSAETEIALDNGIRITGTLKIPENAEKIILFAHGSGSSRFSPRNQYVAEVLVNHGLATLLMDLLTPQEETIDTLTAQYRFDIPLLADRLVKVTKWLKDNQKIKHLKIGYFGSSTGAAAALIAAAQLGSQVGSVVSRGGRPDLADKALSQVIAPTLLIVGGNDPEVLELNKRALRALRTEKRLEIVSGATHLFEEPGKLAKVAQLATDWFDCHG